MKKVLVAILLFVAHSLSAQTVNITLPAQDFAWLIGKNAPYIVNDSASNTEYRKIREQIRTANPAAWATVITVNNIPEWVAMAFYRTVKLSNAGEIAARFSAITTQIESKPSLAAAIASFNARLVGTPTSDYERYRDIGKHIVMDE
jgi:hypothetical protein